MRMLLLIPLLTCSLFMGMASHSVAQGIDMDKTGADLLSVMNEIRKQSGFDIVVSKDLLKNAKPISIHVKNATLEEVLTKSLANQALSFTIHHNTKTVVIKEKTIPDRIKDFFADGGKVGNEVNVQQQSTGRVVDSLGNPLQGASIRMKWAVDGAVRANRNSPQATAVSDRNGNFLLRNVPEDATLEISYIGYIMQEISAAANLGTIVLREVPSALEEVEINAGYYTVTDRERTGSISQITSKDIEKQPISNPLAAMQGRMAGVDIRQTTGVPGGTFEIQIRGRNSISSGNEPLYIINGVPFNTDVSTNIGNLIVGIGSPLNGIDLSNVESIEVLKDADATAIYGSRGANGVVLITTKQGNAGEIRLDLDVQMGIGTVVNKLDLLNHEEYIMMREEALANDGTAPTNANAYDLLLWDTNRNTDWQKKLIGGSANLTNVQTSVSGGNELTSFRLGGGFRKETTVFPGDFNYQKASGHIQVNHFSQNKRFHVSFSGNYVSEINNLLSQDLTSFIFLPPVAPEVYTKEGGLNWGPEGGAFDNPYSYLLRDYMVKTENLVSNANLNYELIPGLKAKVGAGYTTTNTRGVQTTPLSAINPAHQTFLKAEANFNNSTIRSWLIEPQLECQMNVGKNSWNVLIGSSFQQSTTEGQSTYATDFSSDLLLKDVGAAGSIRSSSISMNYKYHAIFGRINYNYDSRYIVNVTGRRDGSSRFGPGNRFANFGAVGAAWIFSNESFIQSGITFLSSGKLRGSFGITGNDQIGNYRYLDSYLSTTYPYQGMSGLYPMRLFNSLYGWESNKKLETAVELGFLRDKIRVSVAWYRNRSSNQLIDYPLPATTGFPSIQNNLDARVENTGIEWELNTENIGVGEFRWNTNVNVSFAENTLLAYPDLENSAHAQVYEVGKSLSLERSYRAMGVNPGTGVYAFEDVDDNGAISYPSDLQSLVELNPDFYGGIGNMFSYKGIQLDVFFQFVKQKGYHPLFLSRTVPGMRSNQPSEVLNRWQQPGDATSIQQFTQNTSSSAYSAYQNSLNYGDNRFTDASFVRLKTVSFSYNIPKGLIRNLSPEVYLNGQNLFTITKYNGLDPESNRTLRLPPLRTVTIGIRLMF